MDSLELHLQVPNQSPQSISFPLGLFSICTSLSPASVFPDSGCTFREFLKPFDTHCIPGQWNLNLWWRGADSCSLKNCPDNANGQTNARINTHYMGDPGSIPELGRSPGEGNGSPRQYSCLENPMDGGAWWATVHRVAKSRTRLSEAQHSTIR